MLILFDIDATLITSYGSGVRAMEDAGKELIGPSFTTEGVAFAGGIDPALITMMLRSAGRTATREEVAEFRAAYGRHLRRRLDASPDVCRTLPGVTPLLEAVHERSVNDGVIPGLLTGNFPETGSMKLAAAGIDVGRFRVCVWGCDSPHDPPLREHLPAVAHARCAADLGREMTGARTVIIGDTPADVGCAKAHGCRSLGVATGKYSVDELRAAGADHAVPTLEDTEGLMRWFAA